MKVAVIADLHFGIKKGNEIFSESQLRFFKNQFVKELKEKDINTIFILGDVFDTRQAINVRIDNLVINLFKNTFKDFDVHIIVGNHDMYHTTGTEVNSLKVLDLLPNVTVYERPFELSFDNKKILMLPWIVDYTQFDEIVLNNYDYCFCHADIIGFDMGGGRLSESGIKASTFLEKVKNVYSGHYHKRYSRKYGDKSITYVGSPYQLTRIDRNEDRGYTIIDFETDEVHFEKNKESMIFTHHVYPNIDDTIISGNVVDIDVPYELSTETKNIFDLTQRLESMNPAYPVNINILPKTVSDENIEIENSDFNIINLFKGYIDQLETNVNKDELYNEFISLFNMFKEDEK